jgi:DNA-binding GntR family transcriptional regulator
MAHGSRVVEGQNSQLIKQNLAAKLKEEIIQGRLAPGQRIVEGLWAKKFGVAQTSVREAINLLLG